MQSEASIGLCQLAFVRAETTRHDVVSARTNAYHSPLMGLNNGNAYRLGVRVELEV